MQLLLKVAQNPMRGDSDGKPLGCPLRQCLELRRHMDVGLLFVVLEVLKRQLQQLREGLGETAPTLHSKSCLLCLSCSGSRVRTMFAYVGNEYIAYYNVAVDGGSLEADRVCVIFAAV